MVHIYKKTCQRFCDNLKRGLNLSEGVRSGLIQFPPGDTTETYKLEVEEIISNHNMIEFKWYQN